MSTRHLDLIGAVLAVIRENEGLRHENELLHVRLGDYETTRAQLEAMVEESHRIEGHDGPVYSVPGAIFDALVDTVADLAHQTS